MQLRRRNKDTHGGGAMIATSDEIWWIFSEDCSYEDSAQDRNFVPS